MKFGLVVFARSMNAGDAIQALAALQFLPRVDLFLDRETLHLAGSDEDIYAVGNAWYMHNPSHWPPAANIRLLPISMHFSPRTLDSVASPENKPYLQGLGPIGARDTYTRDELKKRGIDAYMSGCLTLTLLRPEFVVPSGRIVLCDVSEEVEEYVRGRVQHRVQTVSHDEPADSDIPDKLGRARRLLKTYASAHCVITTRLHAALPALAFGTPVYLIDAAEDGYRFNGLRELVRHGSEADFLDGKSGFDPDAPGPNRDAHQPLRKKLVRHVLSFILSAHDGRMGRLTTRRIQELKTSIAQAHSDGSLASFSRLIASVEDDVISQDSKMKIGTSKDGELGLGFVPTNEAERAVLNVAQFSLAEELAGARTGQDILREECLTLTRSLAEERQSLRETESRLAVRDLRIEELTRALERQVESETVLRGELLQSQKLVSELSIAKAVAEIRIEDMRQKLEDQKALSGAAENEVILHLRQELTKAGQALAELKASHESEKQNLSTRLEKTANLNIQLRDEKYELNARLDETAILVNRLSDENSELVTRLNEAEMTRAQLADDIADWKSRYEALDTRTVALETDHSELVKKLEEAEVVKQELMDNLGETRTELQKLSALYSETRVTEQQLLTRVAAAKAENQTLRDNVWRLNNKVSTLAAENIEPQPAPLPSPQAIPPDPRVRSLGARLAAATAENLTLRDNIWRMGLRVSDLEEGNRSLTAVQGELREEIQRLDLKRADLERVLESMPKSVIRLFGGWRKPTP